MPWLLLERLIVLIRRSRYFCENTPCHAAISTHCLGEGTETLTFNNLHLQCCCRKKAALSGSLTNFLMYTAAFNIGVVQFNCQELRGQNRVAGYANLHTFMQKCMASSTMSLLSTLHHRNLLHDRCSLVYIWQLTILSHLSLATYVHTSMASCQLTCQHVAFLSSTLPCFTV